MSKPLVAADSIVGISAIYKEKYIMSGLHYPFEIDDYHAKNLEQLRERDVHKAKQLLLHKLTTHTCISPLVLTVAKQLYCCTEMSPCFSGASPRRMWLRQCSLADEGMVELGRHVHASPRNLPIKRFQVLELPAQIRSDWRDPSDQTFDAARAATHAILAAHGLRFAIGGMQAHFVRNRLWDDEFGPARRIIHVRLLVDKLELAESWVGLETLFAKSRLLGRSRWFYPFDGDPAFFRGVIDYNPIMKTLVSSNAGVLHHRELARAKAVDHVRLACHLDEVGPEGQIIFIKDGNDVPITSMIR